MTSLHVVLEWKFEFNQAWYHRGEASACFDGKVN